jgi:hypothetical protein
MQGCRIFSRPWWGILPLLCALFVGCAHLPGRATTAPVQVAPTQAAALTIMLGDVPQDDLLAVDQTPTNAQLAQLLDQPALTATLTQWGRTGGTYRVFTFTAPEPGVYNATVRAVIEVDIFARAAGAAGWEAARQAALPAPGTELAVAAPGQHHHVYVQSYHAGDTVATTTTLTFTEGNAAVTITTDFVGPNVSIADAERFAALIDDRLIHGG